jgi:hypothetical protein
MTDWRPSGMSTGKSWSNYVYKATSGILAPCLRPEGRYGRGRKIREGK